MSVGCRKYDKKSQSLWNGKNHGKICKFLRLIAEQKKSWNNSISSRKNSGFCQSGAEKNSKISLIWCREKNHELLNLFGGGGILFITGIANCFFEKTANFAYRQWKITENFINQSWLIDKKKLILLITCFKNSIISPSCFVIS